MRATKLPRLVVIYVTVFLIIIFTSFYIFSDYITGIATDTSNLRLRENVNNNITSVRTMFNKDVVFLESAAATISGSGNLARENVVELLTPLTRYASFRRLAVDLPSGDSYTSDGYRVNVAHMEYLEDVLQGNNLMTSVTYTPVEQERCVAVVVPITQDGNIVGAVRGVYSAERLMDMVEISTFDGEGSFGLIDPNGNHISVGSPNTMLHGDDSVFISMQSFAFDDGYTLDKMRDDMMNKRSGYTVYRNGNQTIYSYYTPAGIGDWYALSSITDEQMGTEKHEIETAAKLLLSVPILLFGLVLLLIMIQNRHHRRKLEQEQEHLRNILDNIPLPLFITDCDKKIEFVNDAAQILFARDRSNLLGKPCYILGASRCATPDCSLDLLLQAKTSSNTMTHSGKTYQTTSAALADGTRFIHVLQDVTNMMDVQSSLQKLASELRVNEELYRIAASHSKNIINDYNIDTKTLILNAEDSSKIGIPSVIEDACETIIGYGLIMPDYVDGYRSMFSEIDGGVPTSCCIILIQLPSGGKVWNRVSFTSVFGSDGKPTRSIGIIEDITSEQDERFRHERELRFHNITQQDSILSYQVDITNGKFISGHEDMMYAVTGQIVNDYEEVCRLLVDYLVYPEDRELVALQISRKHLMYLHSNDIFKLAFEYRRISPGSDKPMWSEGVFYIFDDENDGATYGHGIVRDISEQKQRELSLKQKAERDLLTGLYNKITTESIIREHLESSNTGALMIIDLDNFKTINDTFGHALGDVVISETARHLTELFAVNSFVGRIGGDEFAVFLTDPDDVELIDKHAAAVCQMFHNAYSGLHQRRLSGTVGIAVAPVHGASFEELYRNADTALYNAKALGKDTYSVYHDGMMQIVPKTTRDDVIDINSGKVFADNITEYVLRILYESSDTDITVNAILELLCKRFSFNRTYIFELSEDAKRWTNTYEWCDNSTASHHEDMHQLTATTEFVELFDANGIYQMRSLDEVRPPFVRDKLAARGVQSMLHFAIYQHGKLCAHMGFDNCVSASALDPDGISVLRYTTTLLGNFLMGRSGNNHDVEMATDEMEKVLDSIHNFIYVINRDNHQLRYVNSRTSDLIPEAAHGGLCYKLLRGKDAPCSDCPIVGFTASGDSKFVSRMYNEIYRLWVDTTVSKIQWKGDQRCVLINCNDVDE